MLLTSAPAKYYILPDVYINVFCLLPGLEWCLIEYCIINGIDMNMLQTLSLHLYIGPLVKSIKQLQACDTKLTYAFLYQKQKNRKHF